MISVDKVYQRVLALANKEQRGYITPQEFNIYANQAQMDIFEQYFYDLNQFKRVPGNDSIYSDATTMIEEKIEYFQKTSTFNTTTVSYPSVSAMVGLPSSYYRIVTITTPNNDGINLEVERLTKKEYYEAHSAPLTSPTLSRPQFYFSDNKVYVSPSNIQKIDICYIRTPIAANWTYIVVGDKALYNNSANDKQDFELHPSEETKLVIKILQLAGIGLKDSNLYQVAAGEDNKNIQQQKQ